MAFRDTWHRALVYFGLAEDHEYGPETTSTTSPRLRAAARTSSSAPAARVAPRPLERAPPASRGASGATRSTTSSPTTSRSRATRTRDPCDRRQRRQRRCRRPGPPRHSRATSTTPRRSPTVQAGVPVILNLQTTEHELSKRLIDFASGLTYALDGGMQRIAEKIFLLTPAQRRGLGRGDGRG